MAEARAEADATARPTGFESDDTASVDGRGRTPARATLGSRPGWLAVAVLAVITAVGVVVDVALNTSVGVNYGIIVASLVAILIVRRRDIFSVVVAPPLIYVAASTAVLVLRSGGPPSTRVLFDFGANWLIYGFPSIAAATAIVVLVGAARLIARR